MMRTRAPDVSLWKAVLPEVGLDMTVFPTAAHLASWARICPGNNSSGGKRRPGRTRHGSMWLRIALTEAAQVAARGKGTYLAAHHAQIRGRRGTQKAIGRPGTTSSSPTITLFATRSPIAISDQTGTTAADPLNSKPDDLCGNLNGWDCTSRSS